MDHAVFGNATQNSSRFCVFRCLGQWVSHHALSTSCQLVVVVVVRHLLAAPSRLSSVFQLNWTTGPRSLASNEGSKEGSFNMRTRRDLLGVVTGSSSLVCFPSCVCALFRSCMLRADGICIRLVGSRRRAFASGVGVGLLVRLLRCRVDPGGELSSPHQAPVFSLT